MPRLARAYGYFGVGCFIFRNSPVRVRHMVQVGGGADDGRLALRR